MKQTIVIGHIALIQKSKKQWFTLDLIKELLEKDYDVVGVFAGECREPEYMKELEQKVNQYELNGKVIFLGRRDDVPDLLKMIDVLIIPSSFEGFPLAGLEAAAAGVPIMACDAAGAEEFIRVSGAGMCFAEDNIKEATEVAMYCLQNATSYSKKAQSFAYQCTEEKYLEKVLEVFESCID